MFRKENYELRDIVTLFVDNLFSNVLYFGLDFANKKLFSKISIKDLKNGVDANTIIKLNRLGNFLSNYLRDFIYRSISAR